jgi:gluconolactonase
MVYGLSKSSSKKLGTFRLSPFSPDGTRIGKINLPETCANLCFGGAKKNRLFMAASQSLYSLYVGTTGAQTP